MCAGVETVRWYKAKIWEEDCLEELCDADNFYMGVRYGACAKTRWGFLR